jgi:thiol-disulfide isomerase/thioredoxin
LNKFIFLLFLIVNNNFLASSQPIELDFGDLVIEVDSSCSQHFYYTNNLDNDIFLTEGTNILKLENSLIEIFDITNNATYILESGDSLNVDKNGYYAEFYSKRNQRNLEINFRSNLHNKFEREYIKIHEFNRALLETKYITNPSSRKNKLIDDFDKEVKFLKAYQLLHNLSSQFYCINYKLIELKYVKRDLYAGNSDFPKEYINSIINNALVKLNSDDLLFAKDYKEAIRVLLYLLNNKDIKEDYYQVITANFHNKTKDYVLAKFVRIILLPQKIFPISEEETSKIIKKALEDVKYTEFKTYFEELYKLRDMAVSSSGKIYFANYSLENIELKEIIKGKLIYVDLWASWCVPCIKEMPNSFKLKEKYSEKGIQFLYVSIDQDFIKWKMKMNNLGLKKEESYLITDTSKSSGVQHWQAILEINEVPRYIILNDIGEILVSDAPRPSDPRIIELFDTLLDKK